MTPAIVAVEKNSSPATGADNESLESTMSESKSQSAYAEAGVDIDLAQNLLGRAKEKIKQRNFAEKPNGFEQQGRHDANRCQNCHNSR